MTDTRALLQRTIAANSRMSGTTWDSRRAIRVSGSNWQREDEEIDLALESFWAAAQAPAHAPAR